MMGFSESELRAIGERKCNIDLPMSASDVNREISHVASLEMISQMEGYDDKTLQDIGQRRAGNLPGFETATEVVQPRVAASPMLETALNNMKKILQMNF